MKQINFIILSFLLSFGFAAGSIADVPYIATEEEGAANINFVIYRPSQNAMNSYANHRIYIDGRQVGKLKSGGHIAFRLTPGEHSIQVNDHTRAKLSVAVRNDRTTFVKGKMHKDLGVNLSKVSIQQAISESVVVGQYISKGEQDLIGQI